MHLVFFDIYFPMHLVIPFVVIFSISFSIQFYPPKDSYIKIMFRPRFFFLSEYKDIKNIHISKFIKEILKNNKNYIYLTKVGSIDFPKTGFVYLSSFYPIIGVVYSIFVSFIEFFSLFPVFFYCYHTYSTYIRQLK